MKMMSEWFVPIREGMVSSLPVDTSLYVQDFLNKCLLCKESIEARTIIKECQCPMVACENSASVMKKYDSRFLIAHDVT